MEKLKQWIALTLVGALGILAVGWFVLVSPKRGEATGLRTEAAAQRSANALLETQIEVLKAQAKELPTEQATLAEVAAKIPDNTALPALVRALLEVSSASQVELVSITPGVPVLSAPAVAAAPAPADGQSTPVPGPAAPAVPGAAVAPGAPQLASIPVALNVVGSYFEITQFVAELESLPRSLRVNDLAVTPGLSPTDQSETSAAAVEDGSSLSATISGFVFMATDAAPTPEGTSAATPDAATIIAPAS